MNKINWPLAIAASIAVHVVGIGLFLFLSGGMGGKAEVAPSAVERGADVADAADAAGEPAPASPAANSQAQSSASPAATTSSATATAATTAATYTVRSGDSLTRIARNHGCTVKELADLNGFSVTKTLNIGETIKIPQ